MDIQKIKQLIDVLAASDLAEIELVEGTHRVRLVRRVGGGSDGALGPRVQHGSALPMRVEAPAPPGRDLSAPVVLQPAASQVKAPLYGVVHLTPAPDAPLFVRPGDCVQAGQTVCVLEAMKMFHEVKVEQAARIVAVLVTAGDEVDAGTALFTLEQVPGDV